MSCRCTLAGGRRSGAMSLPTTLLLHKLKLEKIATKKKSESEMTGQDPLLTASGVVLVV